MPHQLCQLAGISPDELAEERHHAKARLVMDALIAKARLHLADALSYCTTLPRSQYRIRLFCLTPLYFAIRTLALAERDPRLLDAAHKVKITRGEVYRTISMTYLVAANNHLVRAYYRQLAAKGGSRGASLPCGCRLRRPFRRGRAGRTRSAHRRGPRALESGAPRRVPFNPCG